MFTTFFPFLDLKPRLLTRQIEQYVAWKALRYPDAAASHRATLELFFKKMRLDSVSEVTYKHICVYCDSFSSTYFRKESMHVLKQFVRYWKDMGLLVHELEESIEPDTLKAMNVGRPVHTDQVQRVQKLVKRGVSLRNIKKLMESEDGRIYDYHTIQRWSRYGLKRKKEGE
jgi:hypothetical protein